MEREIDDQGERAAEEQAREVRRMAELARLGLGAGELPALARELDQIVSHFRVLAEVPDDELAAAASSQPTPAGALRPDEPRPSLARDELLANAPDSRDGFFAVPKTIENTP